MKKPLTTLLALASGIALTASSAPQKISVEGNRFVDPAGNTVVFRGLALAEPTVLEAEGRWNEEHFRQARAWNANLVRIPVSPDRWRARGAESYLQLLDQGVDWAEKNDLHVVIDWHSIGNLKDEKFQNPPNETTLQETLDFWRTVARHYRRNDTVAMYEIFNEPTDFFGKLGELPWDDWRAIAQFIVTEIRKYDRETIPAVAGLKWGYDLTQAREKPFEIEGIAYSIHPYPQKSKEPWEENWETTWGFIADRYPMIALEFGFMAADDPGAHNPCITTPEERFGERILAYFDQKGISWTAWCFHPGWTPSLIETNYAPRAGSGEFFHTRLQKP